MKASFIHIVALHFYLSHTEFVWPFDNGSRSKMFDVPIESGVLTHVLPFNLDLLGFRTYWDLVGVRPCWGFWTKGFGTGLDILDNLGNVALRLQTETHRILKH